MAYAATYRPRPAYDGTRETSVYLAAGGPRPGARPRALRRAARAGRRRRHPRLPGRHRRAERRQRGAARGRSVSSGSARCARWAASSTGGSTPPGGSGCAPSRSLVGRLPDPPAGRPARRYVAHMGATGSGPFENDDALDFLDELADLPAADRGHRVLEALDGVLLGHRLRRGAADVRGRRGRRCRRCLGEPLGRCRRALPARVAGTVPLPTGDEELVEKSRRLLRRAVRSQRQRVVGAVGRGRPRRRRHGILPPRPGLARRPRRLTDAAAQAGERTRPHARARRPGWTAGPRGEARVRAGAGPPSPCRGSWRGRRRWARRPGCAASATPGRRGA